MDDRLLSIWNKSLDFLKNELTEISFNTWIKTIKPVSITDDSIILRVPLEFNKGILETRYSDLIQNTIKTVTSKNYKIKFTITQQETDSSSNSNASDKVTPSVLNPKYTFDTFVIGNSNRFAHAASLAVAESPAKTYNPLFLYGGVGLGKTHLMHAIGHCVSINSSNYSNVLYVSSEKFTNELINNLKDGSMGEFRNKYRNIDLLLMDDIQFIAGKERTQEEFFHTFNALYEAGKQIVISSDKQPKEIATLEERLRSRFEWGLIADIQPPDFETRIAILRKKIQTDCLIVPNDVSIFIADKVASNIRELEGALNRVIAYASLTQSDVSVELASEALKDLILPNSNPVITCELIQKYIASYFSVRVEDLKSKKRDRKIAFPRQVGMFLCRELADISLSKIGADFGGRDHSTVIHACEKLSKEYASFAETKNMINELKKKILND